MSQFIGITLDFEALNQLRNKLGSSDSIFARALKSGISSAAFHLKKKLQSGMKENSFAWPERRVYPNPAVTLGKRSLQGKEITAWLRVNTATKGLERRIRNATGTRFLGGKLQQILRYKFRKENMSAEVGVLTEFTSKKSQQQMRMFQEGRSWGDSGNSSGAHTSVTPAMRKYFAAVGMPLARSTMSIRRPQRPLFGPTYLRESAAVMALLNLVISEKLEKGFAHADAYDRTFR